MATAFVARVVSKSSVVDVGSNGGLAIVASFARVVVKNAGLSQIDYLLTGNHTQLVCIRVLITGSSLEQTKKNCPC